MSENMASPMRPRVPSIAIYDADGCETIWGPTKSDVIFFASWLTQVLDKIEKRMLQHAFKKNYGVDENGTEAADNQAKEMLARLKVPGLSVYHRATIELIIAEVAESNRYAPDDCQPLNHLRQAQKLLKRLRENGVSDEDENVVALLENRAEQLDTAYNLSRTDWMLSKEGQSLAELVKNHFAKQGGKKNVVVKEDVSPVHSRAGSVFGVPDSPVEKVSKSKKKREKKKKAKMQATKNALGKNDSGVDVRGESLNSEDTSS